MGTKSKIQFLPSKHPLFNEKGKDAFRLLSALLVAVLFFAVVFLLASCGEDERERFIWGDYEYVVLDDGTCEIVGYLGSELELSLPSAEIELSTVL